MIRFALFTLFALVGTAYATEDTKSDNSYLNLAKFEIFAIILLIIVNVSGFVFLIHKFHFLQSFADLTAQNVDRLTFKSGEAIDSLSARFGELRKEIFTMAKGNNTHLNKIVSSLNQISEVLRPILATKRDASTDPRDSDCWVDLELGTVNEFTVQDHFTGQNLEELEEVFFYF